LIHRQLDMSVQPEHLCRIPGNDVCVECGSANPRWACPSLGILICIECAGGHRKFGSWSLVRSISLDPWKPEKVRQIECIGNIKANRFWECTLPPDQKLKPHSHRVVVEEFLEKKYKQRLWAPPIDTDGVTNFISPPHAVWMASRTAGGAPQPSIQPPEAPVQQDSQQEQHIEIPNQIHQGVLNIRLLEGVDLVARDITQTSDPYVIFSHSGASVRSNTVMATLNPRWNQSLNLNIRSKSEPLRIRVMDYDRVTADDFMGSASFDLQPLLDNVSSDVWIDLREVESGRLHCSLTYTALDS